MVNLMRLYMIYEGRLLGETLPEYAEAVENEPGYQIYRTEEELDLSRCRWDPDQQTVICDPVPETGLPQVDQPQPSILDRIFALLDARELSDTEQLLLLALKSMMPGSDTAAISEWVDLLEG